MLRSREAAHYALLRYVFEIHTCESTQGLGAAIAAGVKIVCRHVRFVAP